MTIMVEVIRESENAALEARGMAGRFIPLRAPHHSVSMTGMRGEFQLARGGVLYLDDLWGFKDEVIDSLGCLIEEGIERHPGHLPLAIVLDVALFGDEDERGREIHEKRCYRFEQVIRKAIGRGVRKALGPSLSYVVEPIGSGS